MPIHQLVDSSTATVPLNDDELSELLRQARARNQEARLTGLLLHHAGQFVQVLEGEAAAVEALFARIAADPRHRSVQLVASGPAAHRVFPDWSMGFAPLTPATFERFTGYLDLHSPLALRLRTLHADAELKALLRDFLIHTPPAGAGCVD